jgi:hypothetical protein
MRYVSEAFCGGFTPKLLGCYEAELHEVIEQIKERTYDQIIDIGAAEGYYAVGFARHFDGCLVQAFESVPHARLLCGELARLNGVEGRVQLHGECTVAALLTIEFEKPTLVICDCEGYEYVLMDPAAVPGLRKCDLLIELHDCFDERVTPAISARFRSTHEIAFVQSAPHDPKQFPAAGFLPRKDRAYAVDDLRAATMQWAFLTARDRPINHGEARSLIADIC